MKRVFHFSGGPSSALMVLLSNPTPDDIILFTDTYREHPGTYKFIEDFEKHEGLKVHRAVYTNKKAPGLFGMAALLKAEKFLPNKLRRTCTVKLKIKTARRYLRSLGLIKYESYVGFRYDEQHRIKDYKERWKGVKTYFPLSGQMVTSAYVDAFWKQKPYRLGIAKILKNCVFCPMKGPEAIIKIFQHEPEIGKEWIADEAFINGLGIYEKPVSYIKDLPYNRLSKAASQVQTLFPLEDVNPQFSCACNA